MAQARPDPGLRASGSTSPRTTSPSSTRPPWRASTRRCEFADASDFPPPESIYDHVYVLGDQVKGWYSVDERSAGVHKGEEERERTR